MADSALTILTASLLRDVEVVCRLSPRHEVPGCIKRLRENAKLTQQDLARRFHRRPSCVANWESGKNVPSRALIAGILEQCLIPRSVIAQFVTTEVDIDLDATIYARGDAIQIEYDWWQRTRGKALQALSSRAIEGSDQAMKLLFDRADLIEAKYAASLSKPKAVGESSTQATAWTKGALKPEIKELAAACAAVVAATPVAGCTDNGQATPVAPDVKSEQPSTLGSAPNTATGSNE